MKGKKIIISALAASLVAAPIASLGAVSKTVLAEDTTTENDYEVIGPELSVKRLEYPATAKKGQKVEFVQFNGSSADNVYGEVQVYDPFGNKVDTTVNNETSKREFIATYAGIYTYKFTTYGVNEDKKQNTVATNYELTCEVEGDSGSLEIPENSYFVIPSEFLKTKKLTVPVPTCFVNDKACDFDASNTFAVPVSSTETQREAKIEAYLTKGTDTKTLDFVAGTSKEASKQAHFICNDELDEGVWSLTYKLSLANEVVAVSNSKSIKVKSTLTNGKLYASYAKTPSKTAEAGVKYNLVDLNVSFNENSTNYIEAFTQISVKYIKSDTETEDMVVNYDDMTFVPKYTGNYVVTYKAMIPSLGLESAELKYNIRNVTDSTKPTLFLTGGYYIDSETGDTYNKKFDRYDATEDKYYDADDNEVTDVVKLTDMEIDDVYDVIGDKSYNVKSYYQLGADDKVTVRIPAAYVVDNYSKANKLKVTRALYQQYRTGENDKLTLVSALDATNNNPAYNEEAVFEFSNSGYGAQTYVVRYVIQDEFNTESTLDYTIVVKTKDNITYETGSTTKKNLPKVTFNYDEEKIKNDSVVTFSAPTVSDPYDTNCETHVYYAFDEVNASNFVSARNNLNELKNANKNDAGKYEIDLSKVDDAHSKDYLYIIVASENSYNPNTFEDNKNIVVKKVKLIGGVNDDNAPPVTVTTLDGDFVKGLKKDGDNNGNASGLNKKGFLNSGKAYFDQNDMVVIPDFEIKDSDPEMRFEIVVSYMSNGEIVKLGSLDEGYTHGIAVSDESTSTIYTHKISGAKFRISYAKLYTVTIIAIDSNENSTLFSFGVRANDTEAPVISVVNGGKFDNSVEAGKEFTIPSPSIIDDGEIDENGEWSWSVKSPSGKVTNYTNLNTKFTPVEKGTYVITYTGKDSAGNKAPNSEYRLNVKADEVPTITLASVIESYDVEWDEDNDDQKVTIPRATAKDTYFGNVVVGKPVVKNSKGDTVEVEEVDGEYQFAIKTQGKYTVTYTAQGRFNVATKTFTINAGDTEAPELTWKDKAKDLKQTLEVGDTWTFNFNMIEADDNKFDITSKINTILSNGVTETSLSTLKDYATITMTKDNENVGYTIVDNGLQYKFDSAGDYTFTIKLKDEAGNSTGTEYSYTITVNDPEQKTETKNTNAVGTVLIVLSVVILAGVVSYFVISTRKVDNKAKESKNKKDKKDNK